MTSAEETQETRQEYDQNFPEGSWIRQQEDRRRTENDIPIPDKFPTTQAEAFADPEYQEFLRFKALQKSQARGVSESEWKGVDGDR
jgi:hypothetical protein